LLKLDPQEEYYRIVAHQYAQLEEAGKAVIFLGQAASLFGDGTVGAWLRSDLGEFDPIRETTEYRAFADTIVGVEQRTAVEAMQERDAGEKETVSPGLELPPAADPELLRSK
jgi:hypothetical protein